MTSCGGSSPTLGITFNGAEFRAAWNATDFALMEMDNSPLGDSRFSWLGWDRSGNPPTSGTGIHHPSGDVMKISFDNNQLIETSYGSNNGTSHWRVDWDDGVTETGSSGSPLFDQNKRVIGQLHGGHSDCNSSDMRDWYGCFHHSWDTGGTNATQLSNWLDPCNSAAVTTNTARSPSISGPATVCSSGTSYSISNLPPGATISWSTGSPITRVSSQGSNPCTFKSSGSGEGWIQATIDTGFGAITLPRQTVWGGIVLPLDLRLRDRFTGMFKWELCKSEANPVNADHTGGEAHIDDWGWDVSGGYISYDNPYGDNSMVTLRPLSTSFTVELRAHNTCGWSEWADMGVSVIYCGGWYLTMYPNPAKDVVTLSFETADEAKTTEGKTRLESKGAREKELKAYSVQIWSEEKGMVKSIQSDEKEIQIPLHGLEKGKYYLHLIYNDKTYKEVLFVE